jgi:hypothetical protein
MREVLPVSAAAPALLSAAFQPASSLPVWEKRTVERLHRISLAVPLAVQPVSGGQPEQEQESAAGESMPLPLWVRPASADAAEV